MPLYVATFAAVAVSAAQDVFEILTPTSTRVAIWSIDLSQYSDAGDAEDEQISVRILRGYTTTGSGGATITPAKWDPVSTRASACTVKRNNTTVAQDGTPEEMWATAFNVRAGFFWTPPIARAPLIMDVSSRLVVRITAPADALTMNGTMLFEEFGTGIPVPA